jgi:tetratricopeptide (TPR) repeat protein
MRARPEFHCWIAFIALCANAQPTPSTQLENLLKTGSQFSQQGDYQHAIPLLTEATKLAPQNPAANFLLGVALLQNGHASDAIAPLRIAANADPVNESAEGNLGDAEMELKNFALAAEAFQSAVARSPDSEQVLVWWTGFSLERYRALTFSLRASAKCRAALLSVAAAAPTVALTTRESLLNQAAALDPELAGIWGELGVVQGQLGKEAEAESSLKTAQQRNPNASSTLELEALIDAAHGNWSYTEKKFIALGEHSPVELKRFLALWPHKLLPGSKTSGALWQCLRDGSRPCPPTSGMPLQTSTSSVEHLFEESRWEQLTARPSPAAASPQEWFWRGVAFAELNDCSQAIPALERGLKPGSQTAAAWLTTCYEANAVHTADKLKALGSEGAVHQIRGDILLSIRLDPARAVLEYKEALNLNPKDPALLEKLAETYFSLGEMATARQSAQEALQQNPHRQQLLRLIVRIAMSERDYATALASLEQLAQMNPQDAWTLVQQATAYAQTGRTEDAANRLRSALAAGYPDEKGALHAMFAAQLRKLGRDQEANEAAHEAVRLADSFQQQTENKPENHP